MSVTFVGVGKGRTVSLAHVAFPRDVDFVLVDKDLRENRAVCPGRSVRNFACELSDFKGKFRKSDFVIS